MGLFSRLFSDRRPAGVAVAAPVPLPVPIDDWRPLVDLLAEPLPAELRAGRWPAFVAEAETDSRGNALVTALQGLVGWSWCLALHVDWKDPATAVDQAQLIARTHGVTDEFDWDWTGQPEPEVPSVLGEFARWLAARGLRWVAWDRDEDAYYGFAVRPEQVDTWTALADRLRLNDS